MVKLSELKTIYQKNYLLYFKFQNYTYKKNAILKNYIFS